MKTRTTLLAALLVFSGCTAGPTAPPTTSSQPTDTRGEAVDCDDASIRYTEVIIREGGEGVPYQDYAVVAVDVHGPNPPDVRVVVDAPQTRVYRRDLNGSKRSQGFRFGPFSHNAIRGIDATLVGCAGSP